MFRNLRVNVENIPILGPLLLQLTNEAFLLILFGTVGFFIFEAAELALMGSLFFTVMAVLAGQRTWRDFRVAIEEKRERIEDVIEKGLHAVTLEIPFRGGTIKLDIPDSLEPGAARAIVDAVLSVIPKDEDPAAIATRLDAAHG